MYYCYRLFLVLFACLAWVEVNLYLFGVVVNNIIQQMFVWVGEKTNRMNSFLSNLPLCRLVEFGYQQMEQKTKGQVRENVTVVVSNIIGSGALIRRR